MTTTVTLQANSNGTVSNGADTTLDVVETATFAANTLESAADFMDVELWGRTLHTNPDRKRVVVQFGPDGGTLTSVADWTIPSVPSTDWYIKGRIFGPDDNGNCMCAFIAMASTQYVQRFTHTIPSPWGGTSEMTIALQNLDQPIVNTMLLDGYSALSYVTV